MLRDFIGKNEYVADKNISLKIKIIRCRGVKK